MSQVSRTRLPVVLSASQLDNAATWVFTVASLRKSTWAISALDSPLVTSLSTSRSRSVSSASSEVAGISQCAGEGEMPASDFMPQPTATKARSSPNTASTSGVGVMQKVLNSSTKGSF